MKCNLNVRGKINKCPHSVDISLFGTNKPFAEVYADYLIKNNVIILPCKLGTKLYRIRKACGEFGGFKEEYRPTKEFSKPCSYFEDGYWESDPYCKYADKEFTNLDLNVYCNDCLDRFTIQPVYFDYGMIEKVVGTVTYNPETSTENRLYLTLEEAIIALNEIYERS